MDDKDEDGFVDSSRKQWAADNLENFMLYVSHPWRVVWVNFVAGVFRGLGTLVGASIVIALVVWMLSIFKQVPLIGGVADNLESTIEKYMYETNYNDELGRVAETLERIEDTLKQEQEQQQQQSELDGE
ncbi:hypothetical protein EOL70_15800 [Leucothrix sargassi]|nr:hypothetical protein EOL70_15800 [Leucothrix sargassi]